MGKELTPSAISLTKDGQSYVGEAALDRMATHPADTVTSFKRMMGTAATVTLAGTTLTPEDLSAMVLRSLRLHYPELESHLAPERVASWEGRTSSSGISDTGPKWVCGIVIVMLVLAVPRLIATFTDLRSDAAAPPEAEAAAALQTAQADAAVADIFGPGTGMAEVRAADPVFVDQLRLVLGSPGAAAPGGDGALAFVRIKALASAEVADTNNLAVRADLKGMWMAAAQKQSPEVCARFMTGDLLGLDLGLTAKQRDLERALLRQLLEAGVLGHQPTGGKIRYAMPGWLVGDTIKLSGLSENRLVAALTDPDSTDRCTAEAALIAAVLATPQKVPDDVLKGL